MEFDIDANSSLRKKFNSFYGQLSGWSSGGKVPDLASQDLRRTMELQQQHWKSLGLKVCYRFKRRQNGSADVANLAYNDRVFENRFLAGQKELTTTITSGGRTVYERKNSATMSVVIQDLLKGCQPPPDMPLCCPHCGGPATIEQLAAGCPYCDTHIIVNEFYPRITDYDIDKHPEDSSGRRLREFLLCAVIGIVISLLAIPFYDDIAHLLMSLMGDLPRDLPKDNPMDYPLAAPDQPILPGAVLAGVVLGFGMWFLWKLFSIFARMGKELLGTGKVARSLIFRNEMHKIDPMFSSEYFRDRAMHLFRMAAYSKDPSLFSSCECSRPASWDTVIDASLHNLGVDSYRIRGNDCTVAVTLYTDCLIYRRGRISSRLKKIRMKLRKTVTAPTDLGFSVRAVSCPSCGASFDAEQVSSCPFCGNKYDLSKYDWVLTDIRQA
ncbi:MAG: hypothetical protein IJ251_00940 [Oscillospiraceae bacterium]|nr:hypothetical protein [Oscillospiraceae bacterium]